MTTTNSEQGIMRTLQYFFDGFDKLDGELVKMAFHPKALLFDSSEEGSQGIPVYMFCDNLLPFVKATPEHPWNKEKCKKDVLMIDITADIATAKVAWRFSDSTMIDYYTLLCINGDWCITSKTWCNQ